MGGCNSPLIQQMENKMVKLNNYIQEDYDNVQKLIESIIGIKNCHRRLLEDTQKKWYDDADPYDPDFKIEMNYNDWLYMNVRMKNLYNSFVELLENIELEGFKPTDVNHYTSKELKGEYSRWGC